MSTFYLDENIGSQKFAGVLRSYGVSVVTFQELEYQGVEDAIWIPEVAKRGYIVVTADRNFRYVRWEKEAIIASGARIIHLSPGANASMDQLARNFVNTLPKIQQLIADLEGPWLASLTRPERLQDILAGNPGNLYKKEL